MAHELDVNEATGRKAMFAVGETPWHREGVLLAEAPTFEAGLKLAGVDYEVALRDLYVGGTATEPIVKSPTGKAVVRMDRGTVLREHDILSVVGDGYVPLQNRDAFGVLEPLLDKGVAKLETGGSLRGGKDAWMLVRFDIKDPVVQEVFADEVVPFGLITNNHSRESSCLLMQTPIRVVCANTLGAALVGWRERADVVKVAHRGDARVKVVDAAEKMFAGLVERYHRIAEQYALLKSTRLTVDEFTTLVLDSAAPLPAKAFTPEGEHLTSRGYEAALDAAEDRRGAITRAWSTGKGHIGDASAWEAYNGAVEVIDHDAKRFRTTGSRVASLMGGRLLERKEAVLNAVVRHCQVSTN